jgi:hypothetical protein
MFRAEHGPLRVTFGPTNEMTMTTYTSPRLPDIRYVVVEAENEAEAGEIGQVALSELYAEVRERLGREVRIEIRTARPATQGVQLPFG